jgi:hypothetical protein
MEHIDIIRLNIERYRRLLRTNLDEDTRRATERMLGEFETKLVAQLASVPNRGRILI